MSLDTGFSSAGALGGISPITTVNLGEQFSSAARSQMTPEHMKPNGQSYNVAQNYPDGAYSAIGYHPGNGKVFPQAGDGGGLIVDAARDRNGILSSHGVIRIPKPGG